MNLQRCGHVISAVIPTTNIPVDLVCQSLKGHDGHCIGKATIDNIAFEIKYEHQHE